MPTVAQRVAFPDHLVDFDPLPFLSEPWRTSFVHPNALLREDHIPELLSPITSCRTELWHLFWRWDAVKRLSLALEDEVSEHMRCNLFCLSKPDGELRQIIDSRPRNAAETAPPTGGPKI